ncbi:hypothetical protein CXG81DRAFT_24298 [Caulochytrium protostelioides]|uniref:Uncharacterized protein n=1 Tax=Caulochytrium protostelioides TaxID=1555241 RepID=A0A4P9XCE6_9FUNG|nr:hypothetical protein CXG81DRAFT_24298 [Caulochytrium protostelioides]|eukprot:RKP03093.1 hypothetical protein CXG81DRAFT_24298 [Caulochytrium protostelioides]
MAPRPPTGAAPPFSLMPAPTPTIATAAPATAAERPTLRTTPARGTERWRRWVRPPPRRGRRHAGSACAAPGLPPAALQLLLQRLDSAIDIDAEYTDLAPCSLTATATATTTAAAAAGGPSCPATPSGNAAAGQRRARTPSARGTLRPFPFPPALAAGGPADGPNDPCVATPDSPSPASSPAPAVRRFPPLPGMARAASATSDRWARSAVHATFDLELLTVIDARIARPPPPSPPLLLPRETSVVAAPVVSAKPSPLVVDEHRPLPEPVTARPASQPLAAPSPAAAAAPSAVPRSLAMSVPTPAASVAAAAPAPLARPVTPTVAAFGTPHEPMDEGRGELDGMDLDAIDRDLADVDVDAALDGAFMNAVGREDAFAGAIFSDTVPHPAAGGPADLHEHAPPPVVGPVSAYAAPDPRQTSLHPASASALAPASISPSRLLDTLDDGFAHALDDAFEAQLDALDLPWDELLSSPPRGPLDPIPAAAPVLDPRDAAVLQAPAIPSAAATAVAAPLGTLIEEPVMAVSEMDLSSLLSDPVLDEWPHPLPRR